MNPRYDARLLALRLAALLGAQAVALDSVPSLSLAARRTVRRHETIRVPYRRTLVDMRRERLARNFSPLADAVVDALQSKGPHLVFQNRRGNVRALHCRECGWTFRCPRCDTPLAEIVGTFRCPRCAASSPPPLRCPLCRGVRLVGSGWGTERLESFLRERFPSRTLARVDREQPHLPPHSDLIVATEQIFSIPFLPRVQHLVLASLDALRERPDFAAAEDAFSAVERLIALCMPRAAVFIQTFSPESAFARQVAERDDRAFLREEMALRRELRLPPTVTVVKLLLKQRSQRAADDAANRLVRDLRRRAGVRASLTVDDPRTPSPDPAHGWYRRVVLLTCLPGARSSATLRNVLRTLPEHWLVDAHPRTFSP